MFAAINNNKYKKYLYLRWLSTHTGWTRDLSRQGQLHIDMTSYKSAQYWPEPPRQVKVKKTVVVLSQKN